MLYRSAPGLRLRFCCAVVPLLQADQNSAMKHFAPQYPESTDSSLKTVSSACSAYKPCCYAAHASTQSSPATRPPAAAGQVCAVVNSTQPWRIPGPADICALTDGCGALSPLLMIPCAVLCCVVLSRRLRCTWRLCSKRWPRQRTPGRPRCRRQRGSLQAQAVPRAGAGVGEASRGSSSSGKGAGVREAATRYVSVAFQSCCACLLIGQQHGVCSWFTLCTASPEG